MIDYKKILIDYIRIVADNEGVTFASGCQFFLSEEEYKALEECERIALSEKVDWSKAKDEQ